MFSFILKLIMTLFIFGLIIINNAYSLDSLGKENTYLYVETLEDVNGLDSITYLYDISGKMKDESVAMISEFAGRIGQKNGAIYLPNVYFLFEKGKEKYLVNKAYSDIMDIITNSKCTFPLGKEVSYLIYEDRNNNKCFSIDVKSEPELFILLSDIRKVIEGNASSSELTIKRNAESVLLKYTKDKGIGSGLENQIRSLVDYLLSKL